MGYSWIFHILALSMIYNFISSFLIKKGFSHPLILTLILLNGFIVGCMDLVIEDWTSMYVIATSTFGIPMGDSPRGHLGTLCCAFFAYTILITFIAFFVLKCVFFIKKIIDKFIREVPYIGTETEEDYFSDGIHAIATLLGLIFSILLLIYDIKYEIGDRAGNLFYLLTDGLSRHLDISWLSAIWMTWGGIIGTSLLIYFIGYVPFAHFRGEQSRMASGDAID